jgi:hypothetical protein
MAELSDLTSVHPSVLGGCSEQTILSPSRRRRWPAALPSQNAYTERLIPPLVKVENSLPSSDRHTQTGRRLLKPTSGKEAKN